MVGYTIKSLMDIEDVAGLLDELTDARPRPSCHATQVGPVQE